MQLVLRHAKGTGVKNGGPGPGDGALDGPRRSSGSAVASSAMLLEVPRGIGRFG